MFHSPAILLLVLPVTIPCSPLPAGENYAFLVAVGDYDRTELNPLKFTRNDISEFHAALLKSGYDPKNVIYLHDEVMKLNEPRYLSTAENIREELSLLLGSVETGDSVILAFAGHGIQFKDDPESYFCARNARLSRRETLVSFGEVLKKMDACKATRKLLLVDACRNEPQSQISRSRAEVNLESVTRPQEKEIPKSLMAFFSCSPGQQSFEDPDLKHGIFFHHVLKGWNGEADDDKDGSLNFDELQKYVRRETKVHARASLKTLQTPQLKGEISDDWVLRTLTKMKTEYGFVSLFDGKSLGKWDGDPELWRAKDGMIVGETTHATNLQANTFLIYRGVQPADFELKFEYRITSGNSGIQYRSFELPNPSWAMGGYQFDIESGDRYSGVNYGEQFRGVLCERGQLTELVRVDDVFSVRKIAEFADANELQERVRKNDWNDGHIVAKGYELTHRINGMMMSKVTDSDQKLRREAGYLGLQLHKGPPTKVEFRNIRLKELRNSK